MTNIQASRSNGGADGQRTAEIIPAHSVRSHSNLRRANASAAERGRGFDVKFLLREMDILAEELAKLSPSMDRTALELRLAQMRQVVEFRYTQRPDHQEVE